MVFLDNTPMKTVSFKFYRNPGLGPSSTSILTPFFEVFRTKNEKRRLKNNSSKKGLKKRALACHRAPQPLPKGRGGGTERTLWGAGKTTLLQPNGKKHLVKQTFWQNSISGPSERGVGEFLPESVYRLRLRLYDFSHVVLP